MILLWSKIWGHLAESHTNKRIWLFGITNLYPEQNIFIK